MESTVKVEKRLKSATFTLNRDEVMELRGFINRARDAKVGGFCIPAVSYFEVHREAAMKEESRHEI